jgi:hypothetical protein
VVHGRGMCIRSGDRTYEQRMFAMGRRGNHPKLTESSTTMHENINDKTSLMPVVADLQDS